MSRAVDDSGNVETPSAGVTVNVNCPCSLWGSGATPGAADSGDASSVELGMKFTSDTTGTVTGVRFYKAATNTGTHVGSLWDSNGNLLASANFTNETASGWQQVNFAQAVQISANTTYVVGYFAPKGHYSDDTSYFFDPPPTGGNALNSPPLHAVLANDTTTNGLYSYGAASTFPTSTFEGTNYWVDPVFAPAVAPGQVTNVTATAGQQSATVSWSAPSSGGTPTTYTVTPFIGSTAQTPTTVTGSPPATNTTVTGLTAGTSYTFTVQASNGSGSGPVSAQSNAVTPTGASAPSAPTGVTASPATSQALVSWTAPSSNGGSAITGYTVTPYIGSTAQTPKTVTGSPLPTSTTVTGLTNGSAYTFTVKATNNIGTGPESTGSSQVAPEDTIFDFGTPATIDSGDTSAVELGVKFTADNNGTVTGIRFYKAAANTGAHVGSLWSATGTLLASATFSNETATGWQYVTFTNPVSVTAGTTYVAGYFAPKGRYSVDASGLSSAVNNPPLHAIANSTSPNGVYAYNATSTFPSNTFNATNYWVDVLYGPPAPPTPPGQVTNVTATAGQQSATVSWSAPSSGGTPTTYTVTPFIGSTAQTPTTVTGSPPATNTTVTGLTAGTSYTFTVQASNGSGSGPVSAQSNAVTPTGASAPSAPTGVTASPATSQALVSWTAPSSNGGSAITGYTVTPYIGSTAQTPKTVTGSPLPTSTTVTGLTNGSAYTFTVKATNNIGTGPESTASSQVAPEDTIFDFGTPATIDSGDTSAVELGVKFTADNNGTVTGIRFYKAAANTGAHVGSLWSATGTLLASATFSNETATGWQYVTFTNPVSVTAGTTYVAGYFAPKGHYSVDASGLSSAVNNPPLHAIANSTSPNGVYAYNATSTFPSNSFQRHELLGRRAVRAPGSPHSPWSGDECDGDGWSAVGDGELVGAVEWGDPDDVYGHAVYRVDGSNADDRDRLAAGNEHDRYRVDGGNELYVHGAGLQRQWVRSGVGAVQCGDADGGVGAVGADRGDGFAGDQPGAGELDGAVV